jgi:hypothetical protein
MVPGESPSSGARCERRSRLVKPRTEEFEHLYNQISEPFGWKFTRNDLNDWLTRLADRQAALALAA